MSATSISQRARRVLHYAAHHRAMTVGLLMLGLIVVVAIAAPLIAPYPVNTKVGPVFAPPSSEHLLGLDDGGADVFTTLVWAARTSLLVGFAAACVALLVGTTVGVVAGYSDGAADSILMRIVDYFIVIPDLLLAIIVAALWGPSLPHLILVIGLLSWAQTSRLTRAQVKSLKELTYVKRAKVLGASNRYVIRRHIVPHLGALILANGVLAVANAVFAESALAFLGLGDPSSESWGRMIASAFERAAVSSGAWWAIVPPGLAIAYVVVACTLVGRGVEEALNPRADSSNLNVKPFHVELIEREAPVA